MKLRPVFSEASDVLRHQSPQLGPDRSPVDCSQLGNKVHLSRANESSTPKRIVLTGAAGFVGRHLRAALAKQWPDATVVGLTATRTDAGGASDMVVNLLDGDGLGEAVRGIAPDTIIHLAAQSSVAESSKKVDLTWSVNLSGALNLGLAIARHAPKARLLFTSTAEVYGTRFREGLVSESTAPAPLSTYAKSKMLAEQMFAEVLPASTRLIVVRPTGHTGAGQDERFFLPSLAAQIARIEAGQQPPRLMVGNLDVRRDILDVKDAVNAYVALLARADTLPERFTVNVSSGTPRLLADLVEDLRRLSGTAFDIVVDPARLRPVDVPSAAASASLLHAVTGWVPMIDLDQTMLGLLKAARRRTAETAA